MISISVLLWLFVFRCVLESYVLPVEDQKVLAYSLSPSRNKPWKYSSVLGPLLWLVPGTILWLGLLRAQTLELTFHSDLPILDFVFDSGKYLSDFLVP